MLLPYFLTVEFRQPQLPVFTVNFTLTFFFYSVQLGVPAILLQSLVFCGSWLDASCLNEIIVTFWLDSQ